MKRKKKHIAGRPALRAPLINTRVVKLRKGKGSYRRKKKRDWSDGIGSFFCA